MSSEDQILALEQAANERWLDKAILKPKATSWGFFSYGDAPAAIGGGVGTFAWFNNRTALLNFVEMVLPYSPPGPSNTDPLAVADKVGALLARVRSGDLDFAKARPKLNVVLRGYSQIEWMGTFKDLINGNDAYARRLIKQFRQSLELPVGTVPVAVARSQVKDFREFLAEYGA